MGGGTQAGEERILGNCERIKRDSRDTLGEMLKEDTEEKQSGTEGEVTNREIHQGTLKRPEA